MGEKESKINSYIAGVVQKYLPKHEEIIHSGIFLVLSKEEGLELPDWYYNGYSVISETISCFLQNLCKSRTVTFSGDGLYQITVDDEVISAEDLEKATQNLEMFLADYETGIQIVKEANRVFKSSSIGVVG
ncbi:MAG: hypothetical protein HGN29_11975 [Asgard group archaeon]|nr:hypothetical protein [Asgard group archaeon]